MADPEFDSSTTDTTSKSNQPIVSILLRTKNEGAFIEKTIKALLSQTYKNIELIIVDSGSTDETLGIARQFPVSIYEISQEDFTFGYSLNYGIEKAKGEYIVCLSAHAMPVLNDWIQVLVSNFNDDGIAAVMSKTVPLPDCNPFDRRGLTKKYGISKQEIFPGKPYIFSNSCCMIRRSIWERERFNESLIASEDHDWIDRIIKLNYRVIYEPLAGVYHSHNESLKQIYVRYHREAYSNKLLGLERYSLLNVLYDLVAGSVYDMLYVLIKRDNLKWFFFAPIRRIAMNYGRYNATEGIKI